MKKIAVRIFIKETNICLALTFLFLDVCNTSEFYCRWSKTCIPLKSRCNSVVDCSHAEDEWDCCKYRNFNSKITLQQSFLVTLSNGTMITVDADGRSELRSSGIVVFNYHGSWKISCADDADTETLARISAIMCSYLGFSDYERFKAFPTSRLRHTLLRPLSNYSTYIPVSTKEKCSLFYVKCMNEVVHPKLDHFAIGAIEEQFYTPWIAMIYYNGVYQCSGILFDLAWVITSSNCLQQPLQ